MLIDKGKYILNDDEWTFENVQIKVAELEKEVKSLPEGWQYEAYQILADLWLNRGSESRFPEWFEDLHVPDVFSGIFNNIFGDFDLDYF